jgi:hypothetical protein
MSTKDGTGTFPRRPELLQKRMLPSGAKIRSDSGVRHSEHQPDNVQDDAGDCLSPMAYGVLAFYPKDKTNDGHRQAEDGKAPPN